MAHDRDLGVEEGFDDGEALAASLDLDRRAPTLGHQAAGVAHGVAQARVVAQPGHVAHHQRAGTDPVDGGRVVDDVVDRHLEGRLVAEDDHAERVADEDQVGPTGIGHAGRRDVVRSHHRETAAALGRDDLRDRDR